MTLGLFDPEVTWVQGRSMNKSSQEGPFPDYKPVCFSRPLEGEGFDDWVERLIEALDDQGVFGSDSKGGTKNGSDNR